MKITLSKSVSFSRRKDLEDNEPQELTFSVDRALITYECVRDLETGEAIACWDNLKGAWTITVDADGVPVVNFESDQKTVDWKFSDIELDED